MTLALEKQGNTADITLSDTGVGIEKEDLPYVFERYYQGRNSDKQRSSGLGLFIAADIVKKHGGANAAVLRQFDEIKSHVSDWQNDDEIADYLTRILRREAGDGSGLIYGIGHAIYTLSDPRAVVLKQSARHLAENSEYADEFALLERIEKLAPQIYADVTGSSKSMCANVDFYSGMVYKMLHIPQDVFTPLFAVARVTGWCAHRMEEALTGGRIIRPAYKAIVPLADYVPLNER